MERLQSTLLGQARSTTCSRAHRCTVQPDFNNTRQGIVSCSSSKSKSAVTNRYQHSHSTLAATVRSTSVLPTPILQSPVGDSPSKATQSEDPSFDHEPAPTVVLNAGSQIFTAYAKGSLSIGSDLVFPGRSVWRSQSKLIHLLRRPYPQVMLHMTSLQQPLLNQKIRLTWEVNYILLPQMLLSSGHRPFWLDPKP